MESNNKSKDIKKNISKSKILLDNLKSNYILKKVYDNINRKKSLEIVIYNKKIQNRLNLSIKDYKEYRETFTPIEIEIIPINKEHAKFIYINDNNKLYYHIYFNDNKEEIQNKYEINKEDKR